MQTIRPDLLSQADSNRIRIKNGAMSSRFKVDLGAIARDEEERAREENRPYFKKIYSRTQGFFNEPDRNEEKSNIVLGFEEIKDSIIGKREHILKRLAIYPLWRLILLFVKGVIRGSYLLGYAIVHIFRFALASITWLAKSSHKTLTERKERQRAEAVARYEEIIKNKEQPEENELSYESSEFSPDAGLDIPETAEERKPKFVRIASGFFPRLFGRGQNDTNINDDQSSPVEAQISKDKQRFVIRSFLPRRVSVVPAVYFMIVLLMFTLPLKALTYYQGFSDLKGQVLGATESAIIDISRAANETVQEEFGRAGSDFLSARNNFSVALAGIDDVSGLLKVISKVVPTDKLKLASQAGVVLQAGEISSMMGVKLAKMLENFNQEDLEIAGILETVSTDTGELAAMSLEFNRLINEIDKDIIPAEYIETYILMKEKTALISRSLQELKEIMRVATVVLGYGENKRYLMVFQNNTELRASGGFIGSYALIDFQNGEIKNLEVPGGGSYDTEAGLYDMVKSPAPLQLVSPRWYFWDANWWPDWPTSAEKLMWFYEKSNGPTVDGVISLTPTVLEELLKVIGEIDLTAKYGVKVHSENFWKVTQTMAEEKPDMSAATSSDEAEPVRHEPKKIIGDLFSALIEELPKRLDKDTMLGFVSAIEKMGQEKHILMYFKNPETQKTISNFGWSGEVINTGWDYLMVINTNIAGAKTDRDIVEFIDHVSEVQYDNSIINTVTIKRVHTAQKGEDFTGVRNVNWMRVYVPEGSELISASGFNKPHGRYFEEAEPSWQDDPDILKREGQGTIHEASDTLVYKAFNKTVFANWSMIEPGEIGVIVIKYKLPWKFEYRETVDNSWQSMVAEIMNPEQEKLFPHALYAEKQPGSLGSTFRSKLQIPAEYNIAWSYGEGINNTSQGWDIESKLETDGFWALIVK